MENELRFGCIAALYYETACEKLPRQPDLIDAWFPGLILQTEPSDGKTKTPAEYKDLEYKIFAVKYRGRFYSGGSTRVSQILGRLSGTAAGNREKERKTAELIQKHAAECFIRDMELTPRLKENTALMLGRLSEEEQSRLYDRLCKAVYALADRRCSLTDYERKTEPFAMDDETFDGVVYNAAYQLTPGSFAGLCNAYLWLLTGSLLRSEAGRVLRLYDSSFIAVRRQMSETGTLRDKLDYLFHPEQFESVYSGHDIESRFPGVEWYCDGEGCGAHLNEQKGFDDRLPEWKCARCGFVNPLRLNMVYDNEEDRKNQRNPAEPEMFCAALARRKQQLAEEPAEQKNAHTKG